MFRLFFCTFLGFLPLFGIPSVEQLNIEEKVGQILLVHVREEYAEQLLLKTNVGGIIYYPFANDLENAEQVKKISENLQSKSKIPLLIAVDQEGGRVSPLAFCPLPSQREQSHLPIRLLTFEMGRQLKEMGINTNFSPVVDVDSNPNNPIIGNRSFSSDPKEVIRCAQEAIVGYKESGIICCLKHFPGHGDSEVDSHLSLPVISKSLDDLNSIELAPFLALCNQVDLIMTGHLVVPALDPENPATLSYKILTDLLRNKWNYSGVIISDSLIMRALNSSHASLKEIALHAFNAGCDLLCISGRIGTGGEYYEPKFEEFLEIHRYLVECVHKGLIQETRLDESVQRILILKNSL